MSNSEIIKPKEQNVLWYDEPIRPKGNPWDNASGWNEAMPIGNGNMGMMVFGLVGTDRYGLNEDTIWYGGAGRNRVNPEAKDNYLKVRQLLVEGRLREAQDLTFKTLMPVPNNERNYSTAQYLKLSCHGNGETEGYQRYLDMNTATAVVEYIKDGIFYRREHFASYKDGVMVIHLTSYKDGVSVPSMHCDLDMGSRDGIEELVKTDANTMYVETEAGGRGGCTYGIMARVTAKDGTVSIHGDRIYFTDCSDAVIYITIRSTFYGEDIYSVCLDRINKASEKGIDAVREDHIKEYQALFNRVSLTLKGDEAGDIRDKSIAYRLNALKEGSKDTELVSLYFQFGRYLLLSCSRPGSQCANLQGIWNTDEHPPWGSKYTININTEMNYWPAEVCNLGECHEPLFDLLWRMYPNGVKVAEDMYGLSGFVAHHNTDIFGDCAPQDTYMPATIWPMGAAWLCTHIMTHYEYTCDRAFLEKNFPLIREACRFFTQYMFLDDRGRYVTGPSCSPENTYIHTSGEMGTMCIGPSMDSQILMNLFDDYMKASEILGESDPIDEQIRFIRERLPKPSIGRHGQVMEWPEDYEETEPGHRHISHLYGLYPYSLFNEETEPELFKAARVTLERRLSQGGGHTGWSRAWIINMWARLLDGEKAGENVRLLLEKSTSSNMFDMHPPFQIDGNFGGCAGIAEMLMQSHESRIVLLPAVPKSWKEGEVRGLVARGNILVNFSFKEGRVYSVTLLSRSGRSFALKLNPGMEALRIEKVGAASVRVEGDTLFAEKENASEVVFGITLSE